jgi:type VI secretion system protein ImpJ
MRVMPPAPARVVWAEGMYLAPHHFQAQRRHAEHEAARLVDALFPFAWGLSAVALDEDALGTGVLALAHARGLLPDGTPVHVPDADAAPPPLALADHFSPTRDAHTVLLVLPPWRSDAPNVEGGDVLDGDASADDGLAAGGNGHFGEVRDAGPGAAAGARYAAVTRPVVDETSGRDSAPVRFAAKRLRLALDDAVPAGAVAIPVARVRRDGGGRFVVDGDYVPPCLTFAASERLVRMLAGLVGMLEAKGAALAATLAPVAAGAGAAGQQSAYVGNELATRWLLHAVRSAEAPLRHLAAARYAHPERLFAEMAKLAGALCTFSLTTRAADLPLYAHEDLTGCFAAMERHLRTHLDVVVAASAVVIPLARVSEVLHTATVTDARCLEPGARWFLGVRAAIPAAEVAARVPALVKACATRYVLELVRRAYPGMRVDHLPAPPSGLAPRPGVTYFELTREGPCAQGLLDTQDFGVYVPDGLPDAALELAVLIPG